jgi:hypothetical protein
VRVEWKSYEAGCKNSAAQSFFFSTNCADRTVHYLKNSHQFMAIQPIFYFIEGILWRLIATQLNAAPTALKDKQSPCPASVLLHNDWFCNGFIKNDVCITQQMCRLMILFHGCSIIKDESILNI